MVEPNLSRLGSELGRGCSDTRQTSPSSAVSSEHFLSAWRSLQCQRPASFKKRSVPTVIANRRWVSPRGWGSATPEVYRNRFIRRLRTSGATWLLPRVLGADGLYVLVGADDQFGRKAPITQNRIVNGVLSAGIYGPACQVLQAQVRIAIGLGIA